MLSSPTQTRDFFWIILVPLTWFYSFAVATSVRFKKKEKFNVPVISVGNLHLGGTGKTPLVMVLADYFSGKLVAVVSRGYKGKASRIGSKVDLTHPKGALWFGDEPWMIAQQCSADVFVGANRTKNFKKHQIEKNYQISILDDGYQHTQIARDVNILVLPGEENPWELNPLPLGTLRESVTQSARATHVVIIGGESIEFFKNWKLLIEQFNPRAEVFFATRKTQQIIQKTGKLIETNAVRWGAFCGIAHPQRLQKDLSQKMELVFFKVFTDHYSYPKGTGRSIIDQARNQGVSALITTYKDYYKVREEFETLQFPLFVAHLDYQLGPDFWNSIEKATGTKC